MKGRVTRVVKSEHCPEGRMYMINESLLLPPEDEDKQVGICLVVWDNDDVYVQAQQLIGEYIEIETKETP